jgi:polyhydroxybutyrate depolymerase
MSGKSRKIMVGALVVFIGLPATFILAVSAWGYLSDTTNGSIVSSGVTRRYLLYVPKTYDRSKPMPLIISIHPAATWPVFERNVSRWNELANQYGFIVVYPAGRGAFFGTYTRGASVWPAGPRSLPQDVRFISDLIDKFEADYSIDPSRIYADGMSNGGGMAFLLSCKLSDRIAAVGIVSGALPGTLEECGDSRPVPTIAFHGTADKVAPFLGGKSPIAPGLFPSIPDWTARLASRNQCKGDGSDTRISPQVRRLAYTNCAENADVVLYTIQGGGHSWPGGKPLPEWIFGRTTSEISASRVMWEFFVQHPRGRK